MHFRNLALIVPCLPTLSPPVIHFYVIILVVMLKTSVVSLLHFAELLDIVITD